MKCSGRLAGCLAVFGTASTFSSSVLGVRFGVLFEVMDGDVATFTKSYMVNYTLTIPQACYLYPPKLS